MPPISFTAPHLTEKDEKKELSELTTEEKDAILNDLYGRRGRRRNRNNRGGEGDNADAGDNAGDDEDDDISPELLQEFLTALEEVPPEDGADFWAAMADAPDVVESESSPERFLRFADYDANEAALCLCKYWKMRVKIFPDTHFEPMTLRGAMKRDLATLLEMNRFMYLLPDDDHGRAVLCLDKTNIKYRDFGNDQIVFVRLLWFVTHMALERESTQKEGIVGVAINRASEWDFLSRDVLSLFVKSLSTIPVRFCSVHLCFSSLEYKVMLPVAKMIMTKDLRQRIQNHTSVSTPSVLKEMKSYGLQSAILPKSIGGEYNQEPTWAVEIKRLLRRRKRHRERRFQYRLQAV